MGRVEWVYELQRIEDWQRAQSGHPFAVFHYLYKELILYLAELAIKNFRTFYAQGATIKFQQGLMSPDALVSAQAEIRDYAGPYTDHLQNCLHDRKEQ